MSTTSRTRPGAAGNRGISAPTGPNARARRRDSDDARRRSSDKGAAANVLPGFETLEGRQLMSGNGTGLAVTYFDNADFTGAQVSRVDQTVNFRWSRGSPDRAIGPDTFSARWSGSVLAEHSETYTFHVTGDDGYRLAVDGQEIVSDWSQHSPRTRTGTITLEAGRRYDLELEYFEGAGRASAKLEWSSPSRRKQVIPKSQLFPEAAPEVGNVPRGLKGEYFDNEWLQDLKVVQVVPNVDYDWRLGSPDPSMGEDGFSVRWVGQVKPRFSEEYSFHLTADDGMRLYVNGQTMVDDWADHSEHTRSGTIRLQANRLYNIKVEYYERTGLATAKLHWSSASQPMEVIPSARLFPITGPIVDIPNPAPNPVPEPNPNPNPNPDPTPDPDPTPEPEPEPSPTAGKLAPSDSKYVDVKAKYGAKGDGRTDDTNAIQKAIRENMGKANTPATLYFPAGTYVVSKTLYYRLADTNTWSKGWRAYLVLQGEGEGATTIKLKDNAAGFSDPNNPQAVIYTASADWANRFTVEDGRGNEAFQNSIYDMTIDTGTGNEGAVGIDYLASNKGTIRNVEIKSGDGKGVAGLSMRRPYPGPAYFKNVSVKGFDYGVDVTQSDYVLTFEDLQVSGQKVAGVRNTKNNLVIRNLVSNNSVPAVVNDNQHGMITLLDSTLTGTGGASAVGAIENSGAMFVRNVTTTGYKSAVKHDGQFLMGSGTGRVGEWTSDAPRQLFESPRESLGLTVREAPIYEDRDFSKWANVLDYRRAGDGGDIAAAFQRAIDSGKTTVYLPAGGYWVRDTIKVRGNVRRILGMDSALALSDEFENPRKPKAVFRIENTAGPDLTIERLNSSSAMRGTGAVWFEHAGTKDVVLRDVSLGQGTKYRNLAGSGDLFLEDVCSIGGGGAWEFGHGQSVWARQFNPEMPHVLQGLKILNNGAKLWIMGLKTEGVGTLIKTTNGGSTELLGACVYPVDRFPTDMPLFINENSRVSLTYSESAYDTAKNVEIHVRETRDGVTRNLTRDMLKSNDDFVKGHGTLVTLYSGYKA